LLFQRLALLDPVRLRALRAAARWVAAGAAGVAVVLASTAYVALPALWFALAVGVAGTALVAGAGLYLSRRPGALHVVWPASRPL
jgi:hypothetical protein